MIDASELDSQIESINKWITKAGDALQKFYNPEMGVFWRDTTGLEAKDQGLHPTATNRSFLALREYLRFLEEEDQSIDTRDEVKRILQGVAKNYLSKLGSDPEKIRDSKTNRLNMFTDSQLLISISLLSSLKRAGILDIDIDPIKREADLVAKKMETNLLQWQGGRVHPDDDVHDFVTLHCVRGLDAYFRGGSWGDSGKTSELRDRINSDVLRMLAFHYAGVTSRFDPSELIFSIELLNRFYAPDVPQLTRRAIQSISEMQAKDGSFPTARFVSYEGHGLLHVASYEVLLTLTHITARELYYDEIETCEKFLPSIARGFELVRTYYNTVHDTRGWANDHARKKNLIESWTTAIVLTFLIHYHDLLIQLRQRFILQKYERVLPKVSSALPWPDTVPMSREPGWVNLAYLDAFWDPTEKGALIKVLKGEIVTPVGNSWIHRPKKASFILFGPPGTGKTRLVTCIAKSLDWPLVTLSPRDFLSNGGIEGFESAATAVFVDLLRLRRVVILFDECEDFFKARPQGPQNLESRTTGAFITAGMLPRLQALRDKRWLVFSLATNGALKDLDEAVKRRGRFDYAQNIPNPTLDAQIRYVTSKIPSQRLAATEQSLREYDHRRADVGGRKLREISFATLDDLVKEGDNDDEKVPVKIILERLKKLTRRKVPESFVE